MSVRAKTPTTDDPYCQLCSSASGNKRLSSFSCDHCRLLLCYDCFEKHTTNLPDEHSQLQKRFFHLTDLFLNKKQLFATFEEHCLRNVNSTFDEIINDLQKLRKESIDYVKQQFNDAEVRVFSEEKHQFNQLFLDCSIRYDYPSQTFPFKISTALVR